MEKQFWSDRGSLWRVQESFVLIVVFLIRFGETETPDGISK
jgi:hypothetical protein